MKRSPLTAAATLTLLMTSALFASQNYAQDQTLPEVKVTGEAPSERHPQDPNYSQDRLLGCVEVVTPSAGGNELSGSHQARFAKAGIAVMPSLDDPRGGRDNGPPVLKEEHQPIPPGWTSSTPPCS